MVLLRGAKQQVLPTLLFLPSDLPSSSLSLTYRENMAPEQSEARSRVSAFHFLVEGGVWFFLPGEVLHLVQPSQGFGALALLGEVELPSMEAHPMFTILVSCIS